MGFQFFLICLLVITVTFGYDLNTKQFPANFMIGTASAAVQIEGAWDEDGKGENIWDKVCHTVPSPVLNNDTADVACDSYHKYEEDIALLKDLGVNVYRFSISWSRIMPTGYSNKINEAGVAYYKNLINKLKENNIEPLVTIYHWDLPQPLQDLGGWVNEIVIDNYVDFADVCFEKFGKDVKYWITFNEPKQVCEGGYGEGYKAPLIQASGIGGYRCTHTVLKAHARVWHLYDEKYRTKQGGKVGITIDTAWFEPDSTNDEDIEAAERYQQFNFGWYANPIMIGDYPEVMKEYIGERSIKQGFKKSRLPTFTSDEIEYIKNTADFLGVNFYTSSMVGNQDVSIDEISWQSDAEIYAYQKEEWEGSASSWLKVTPWGLRKLMNWVQYTYGNISIIITENGISDNGTTLEDDRRINYFEKHLSNLRDSMDDGVNVIGYTAWSLTDNFEWLAGYSEKFGIYHVDFTSSNRTRTPKKSAEFYRQFCTTRCIVDVDMCTQ